MRGVNQLEPKATVEVIFSGPFGRSFDSEIRPSAIDSLANTSRAVRNNNSPCSVRIKPRAWRWNKGTLRLSSSALICRLTADWLRFSDSPAWVKLPASATAWKMRSLSQSITGGPSSHRPAGRRHLAYRRSRGHDGGFARPLGRQRAQEALGLQSCHAAHA